MMNQVKHIEFLRICIIVYNLLLSLCREIQLLVTTRLLREKYDSRVYREMHQEFAERTVPVLHPTLGARSAPYSGAFVVPGFTIQTNAVASAYLPIQHCTTGTTGPHRPSANPNQDKGVFEGVPVLR